MTSPTAPAHAGGTETLEAPFPPAPIEELLRLLVKAGRAHQLYLPNNPIYKQALDALRVSFAPIWSQVDEIALSFTETEIRWYDHTVLSEPKSADSLPWLFYKDGVRELTLLKGFEDKEVIALLSILQRARKASPDQDDLLTMLWEADFAHARYRYQDLGMDAAPSVSDGTDKVEVDPSQRQQATHTAVEESTASGIVNLSDFDSTLYFLDENEIDYLQTEIKREYQEDLRRRVTSTLLDIFEQQPKDEVRKEILEILDGLLVNLLASGHFRGVAHLIRETQATAQRVTDLSAQQKRALLDVPARLSTADSVTQLLQSLDEAAELPPQDELSELFDQLRPIALGTVFGWLRRMQNPRLHPLLESAAERLASANTSELVRLIVAPEREVALEAIKRSGALKTAAAVQSLSRVLDGPDVELRQMTVHALTEIGSPGALQALERGVEDTDREVRISTVRALSARSYRLVLPRIEKVVKGKEIREADLTEKMAFFEAYGALSGAGGVEYLDSVLNGKGFLGKREESEVRACAAIALGRINTPNAADVLRKASSEKDVVVRNAVNRALRGAMP